MNYRETLDFLYSQLPMYQRVGAVAFKKGLGNTRTLLRAFGNPHRAYPAIHIAGTNGKGTVSHMLAAYYQAMGLKVGLYCSPHYKDFRERIRINGQNISAREVVGFTEQVRDSLNGISPSFFEITVVMAFEAFARHEVDLAVVETGLGGRLDSTNVITPVTSVITNISFDHMAMLGNTLPAIAREKAGIIKPHVPVVIGEYDKMVADVFRNKARDTNAPLSFASQRWRAELVSGNFTSSTFHITRGRTLLCPDLVLGAGGPFQSRNIVTTLEVIDKTKLPGVRPGIDVSVLRRAMLDIRTWTGYQGRWQVLGEAPVVLCDSAHNEAGLAKVLEFLGERHQGKVHFVLGFAQDKDVNALLKIFPAGATYYYARPDVPRGMPVDTLVAIAGKAGRAGKGYSSVRRALAAARRSAGHADLIFVGGSSFVAAEVI